MFRSLVEKHKYFISERNNSRNAIQSTFKWTFVEACTKELKLKILISTELALFSQAVSQ
jgi:hypothetical protein